MSKDIPRFKLTDNISIGYIPSEFQLLQKAEQVFDFNILNNCAILISKKDKQSL